MENYVCTVCGYLYDSAVGDPKANIEPGIPFATLPEDWKCPQCGSDESKFETENTPMPGMVAPIGE
jgi:rubredoxin